MLSKQIRYSSDNPTREPVFLKDVRDFDLQETLRGNMPLENIRDSLREGVVFVARKAFPKDQLNRIKDYLRAVGRSSLPNYFPIENGAPNSHRMAADPRSHVQGSYHQWIFYPWNMDVFGFFEYFRSCYILNNRINNWPDNKYLGIEPDDAVTARLSFQCYPRGCGYLNRHQDSAGPHKFTTMSIIMSDKGEEFEEGGLFFAQANGKDDLLLDDIVESGDVVYRHSEIVHGIQPIDPTAKKDWLAFQGKWTLLMATNRLASNRSITDPLEVDYGAQKG